MSQQQRDPDAEAFERALDAAEESLVPIAPGIRVLRRIPALTPQESDRLLRDIDKWIQGHTSAPD